MPRVFVVQSNSKHNLTPALKYGHLELILPAQDLCLEVNELYDYIHKKLEIADRSKDWLLLSGDPVAICLATLAWDDTSEGHVRLLKWDKLTNEYNPHIIDLSEREQSNDDQR